MVTLNAQCSVPASFSFLRLGCEGFPMSLSSCSQNLILTSLGSAFRVFKTDSGTTISVAKVRAGLFDRLEDLHLASYHVFTGPANAVLPGFRPKPGLMSRHLEDRADDNLVPACGHFHSLSDLERDLRSDILRNGDLVLLSDLDRCSHKLPPA